MAMGSDDDDDRRSGASLFVAVVLAVVLYTQVPPFRDAIDSIRDWTRDLTEEDIVDAVESGPAPR